MAFSHLKLLITTTPNSFQEHYNMKSGSYDVYDNFGNHGDLGSSLRTDLPQAKLTNNYRFFEVSDQDELQQYNFEKTRDTIELFSPEISNITFDAQFSYASGEVSPNLLENNTHNLGQVNEGQLITDYSGNHIANLGQSSQSRHPGNFQISSRHATKFRSEFPCNYEQHLPSQCSTDFFNPTVLYSYTDFGLSPNELFEDSQGQDFLCQTTSYSISMEPSERDAYVKVNQLPGALSGKYPHPTVLLSPNTSVEQNKQNTYEKIAKERHKCNICGKSFTGPCALQIHGVSHTGEKRRSKFL
ncbi:17085_t:CDS:1 [Acaulospora morrowiae]|uniref:17085_t:CDS:1 n=1 Tax=Acaulospora morrowiae TaxID=94023 RepID=A0A9N8WMW9_9GLOM|nr:17085_t:CDS:1 [Acaulospora morrowiae]